MNWCIIFRGFAATYKRPHCLLYACAIALIISASGFALAQRPASAVPLITLKGTVRDSSGRPMAGATVCLQQTSNPTPILTQTKVDGTFVLSTTRAGIYSLKVEKAGWNVATRDSLQLSTSKKLLVDFVLEPVNSALNTPETMEFDDKPNFTVAGVTDQTQAGGHGSDVALRTSESLARETVALKPEGVNQAQDIFLVDDSKGRKQNAT